MVNIWLKLLAMHLSQPSTSFVWNPDVSHRRQNLKKHAGKLTETANLKMAMDSSLIYPLKMVIFP